MSLKFSIHAQSSLKCSDVDNGTVSYTLPSVLKLEPGRCMHIPQTGIYIHDCDPSGRVHVTPVAEFVEKLSFSENILASSPKEISFSITNTSNQFVRVESTQLLCKYHWVANPTRGGKSSGDTTRSRSRNQMLETAKADREKVEKERVEKEREQRATEKQQTQQTEKTDSDTISTDRAEQGDNSEHRRARARSQSVALPDTESTPKIQSRDGRRSRVRNQTAPAARTMVESIDASLAAEMEEVLSGVDTTKEMTETTEATEAIEQDDKTEVETTQVEKPIEEMERSPGRQNQKKKRITV